ncbi:Lithostathine-1, partial [Aphelenchoides avenae]
ITYYRGSWSDKRVECKQLGGDLISIPDNATSHAVADFVYKSLGMGDDEYTSFAIGLHKPFANNQWQWTDGSLVTFINWEAGYDDDDGLATIAFMD